MLKDRVITGFALLTVLLTILFLLPPIYWAVFLLIVVLLGFHEWLQLVSVKKPVSKILLSIILLIIMYCLHLKMIPLKIIIAGSILLWTALILAILTKNSSGILFSQLVKLIIAVCILATTWWLLNELRMQSNGSLWILFFLAIIWSADIGAYFVGKRFGKTKLAPDVSPGKTVVGMVGGLLAVSLLSIIVSIKILPINIYLPMLLVCLLTAVVSVAGDLYESQLKRQVGMKDSGNILPGHGGILDRIDSILAGLPFFLAGLILLKLLPEIA